MSAVHATVCYSCGLGFPFPLAFDASVGAWFCEECAARHPLRRADLRAQP